MSQVKRFDIGQIRKAEVTPQGYLKADAMATRVGVFRYVMPDGTVRRELRPPEEVFQTDSMKSLAELAVTNEHPPEMLTSKNTKQYQVGFTNEAVDKIDSFLKVGVTVTDSEAVRQIKDEGKAETSCGYTCQTEEKPGVWNGETYDAIQRNIRYNHLAVVKKGRAGPNARIRLDAADAVQDFKEYLKDLDLSGSTDVKTKEQSDAQKSDTETKQDTQGDKMTKVKIDSVEYEVSEAVASVIVSKIDALEASKKEIETLKGRADAQADEIKKKDEEITKIKADRMDDSQVMARARVRLDLEDFAKKVLGDEAKFDGKSDSEIQKEIIAKQKPEFKLDGKDESYVAGCFGIIRDSYKPGDKVKDTLKDLGRNDAEGREDSTAIRMRNMKASQDAWKTTKTFSA